MKKYWLRFYVVRLENDAVVIDQCGFDRGYGEVSVSNRFAVLFYMLLYMCIRPVSTNMSLHLRR